MSITMPYALKQMKAMYQRTPDQTHARFVHYTTAEAALNIICTKRFWLRNTNCMSDYCEVQHGFDIFNRYFLDAAKRKAFVDAFDACTPGVADDAFTCRGHASYVEAGRVFLRTSGGFRGSRGEPNWCQRKSGVR
jgi:hypothetical protein